MESEQCTSASRYVEPAETGNVGRWLQKPFPSLHLPARCWETSSSDVSISRWSQAHGALFSASSKRSATAGEHSPEAAQTRSTTLCPAAGPHGSWGPTGGSSGLHFTGHASHLEGLAFRNVASMVAANSQVNSQKVAYLKGLLTGDPVCRLYQSILAALREQEDQHCKALPKPV